MTADLCRNGPRDGQQLLDSLSTMPWIRVDIMMAEEIAIVARRKEEDTGLALRRNVAQSQLNVATQWGRELQNHRAHSIHKMRGKRL